MLATFVRFLRSAIINTQCSLRHRHLLVWILAPLLVCSPVMALVCMCARLIFFFLLLPWLRPPPPLPTAPGRVCVWLQQPVFGLQAERTCISRICLRRACTANQLPAALWPLLFFFCLLCPSPMFDGLCPAVHATRTATRATSVYLCVGLCVSVCVRVHSSSPCVEG